MEFSNWTVTKTIERLRKRDVSSAELTQSVLDRIHRIDPSVKAFLSVLPDRALAQAAQADRALARGQGGPLAGVPIAVKDIFCMANTRTTAGSKILADFIAPYDSTVTTRLEQAGAVIVGKTAMDEFAMGSSGENCAFGPTFNPWAPDRVPGGSSSGSAAAVAARMVPGALGTDTGGSIRQPAAFCGVVGLKPTYGRVSRYGIVAFASSLDQAGPFGRSACDVARILAVVAGHDPRDATSSNHPVPDYPGQLSPDVKGLKVGVPEEYLGTGIDPEIQHAVRRVLSVLESRGAHMIPLRLPHTQYALAAYYIIAPAEASSNLARYDGMLYGHRRTKDDLVDTYFASRAEGFGREVRRRIMVGTFALSSGYYDAYYNKACRVRTLVKKDFKNAFDQVDVIAAPATPEPPFRLGEKLDDPLAMYLSDALTIPVNMAGLPGLTTPCGFTASGLPIGLQLIGPPFGEQVILNTALAVESEMQALTLLPELARSPSHEI